ncbi:MAG: RdgB/HAM1 family non-canonical purine NTP pyrophosphatase [Chthoniobacterales bacterium]
MDLLLATRNAHKTREFSELLGPDFKVRDLTSRSDLPIVDETGSTFAENAALKALAISKCVSGWIVADDSGLEVEALNGAPGIFSARYAGESATDQENVAKLLRQLSGKTPSRAHFRCVLALAKDGALVENFDGVVEGHIVAVSHGTHGFGYDPVFVPDGFSETFAELPAKVKNAVSHRAKAVAQLSKFLLTR